MRWFGLSWGAPVCEEGEQVATPVGAACGHCEHEIDDGDRGLLLTRSEAGIRGPWVDFPVHLHCLLEMVT